MKHILYIFVMALMAVTPGMAQDPVIPEAPKFINPVVDIDGTGLLDENQIRSLSEKIIRYNDTTSTELLVVLVNTTRGEEASRFATDLGHKWRIGQKGKDNGIVFLIAKDDRKVAIATGRGSEARLTDAMSKRVIEQIVTPEFKAGNYYVGIDKGVDAIVQVLKGEFKGTGSKKSDGGGKAIPFIIIFIILVVIIARARKGGGGGGRRGGGLDLTDIILLSSIGSSHGRGGGGFGGFGGGGGGFGGFGGGGSFGGGGASGSW